MMRGYTTNYVNLIADNLRDRYESGFPILKELIQNADDAKARRLIFGSHDGFPDASNPLLKGSGLWCFNDGEFKKSDVEALRSFGINSKASDTSAIGKFGLGMKSVFHLCEALFYVAWDGTELHREGLTPWKQDDCMPHPEWDETPEFDWDRLTEFCRKSLARGDCSWFLLWIPLRSRKHLETPSGQESGYIIERFPGDDPSSQLAFLNEKRLARDLAEMLPLLRHIECVEHRGKNNRFAVRLADGSRLMGIAPRERVHGQILKGNGRPLLNFSGRGQMGTDADSRFVEMRALDAWPQTWFRDELGRASRAPDKTSPEAAVLLCSGRDDAPRSRLQWAVFLPVEDGSENIRVDGVTRGFSLILHGQFFLDSGRKKLHGLSRIHDEPSDLGDVGGEESELRTIWNQRLCQDVLLPLVLPVLDDHVRQHALSGDECSALTKALSDSDWFKAFRKHICRDAAWVRTLEQGSTPRWRLVEECSRFQLRPVPSPESDPERPWKVFVELAAYNVIPYDREAPCLGNVPRKWDEPELVGVLSRVEGLFVHAPSMDYLIEFLDSCAGVNLSAESIQQGLLDLMRHGLRAAGTEARRRLAAKASRFIAFLEPKRRIELSADLSEPVLNEMWKIDASVLPVPKSMDPEPHGNARPNKQEIAAWMGVLNRALDSAVSDEAQDRILRTAQGLLKTLAAEAKGRFLKENRELRIIGVQDARSGLKKPVSFEFLEDVRRAGTLFRFAAGLREARMGITPLLALAIPDAEIGLVQTETYRELFPDDGIQGRDQHIPAASDGPACLAAVGRLNTGRLGEIADRRNLLENANDPGTDAAHPARRGLRLLLHGSPDHRMDDQAKLWIGRHNQHPAWNRLWDKMHGGAQWSRIPETLADAVPRNRWTQANIVEIDARTLIDALRKTGQDIEVPEEFSEEEREEILSQIDHEELWLRLPLHTALNRELVSAAGQQVYLAPAVACDDDPLTHETILIAPSQNPVVADQQKRWLPHWDDRARIKIALGTEKPSRYWRSVMDALHALSDPPAPVSEDVWDLLRSRAWLPTTYSAPVKPEDVIDLKGSLGDETHRLVAEHRSDHGPCFAVPVEIDPEVRDHPAWERLRGEGFSSGPEGLEHLGLMLEDLGVFNIGVWWKQPGDQEVELLSHCVGLPGWRLLKTAAAEPFDLETAWQHLGQTLSKEIESERLVAVLDWLTEDNAQWDLRKSIYDTYLRQFARCSRIASEHLPDLRLASAGGQWRKATELCTGAHGVVRAVLLDTKQADLLGDLIYREDTPSGLSDLSGAGLSVEFQTVRKAAPEIVRDYFRTWDTNLVPPPMIGVLLGLLGPGMRELANEYLRPHSFEWLIKQLPWSDPGQTPPRWEWMGNKTVDQALELIQAGVRVETGKEVEVRNLVGQPIRVALDQEARTLLAGGPSWQGGYGVMIPLRRFEHNHLEGEHFSEVLRATAEQLYRDLYNQADADFGTLWQEMDQSDQLEIGIARRLILDHIPIYLRQLSVKGERIEKQLATWDLWRHRIAETEAGEESAKSARKELKQALEELADCIDQNPDERQAVVRAVRNKLEQYQYELSSIPLELFQNADDAAVQLGQFHVYPSEGCEVPLAARRFVVEEREKGLGFLHWGRPVNARGPVGFDGERRGYGRDLENMLILSATDKSDDEGVTGKFGLGFKSVLLACEQPRIVSGRLAVRVVSGILPQPWNDAQEARQRLIRLGADSGLPGTLIDLPGVQGGLRDQVLKRFCQFSGILCVFGRAIRSITCVSESESESIRRWQPTEICPGVEAGELHLQGDWGTHTKALCVRADSGSLLMALEPRGFRPLPDTVPALWVTAPTSESSAVGFAVNGSFDLDVGRGRLAGSTDSNREKAKRIGMEAGDSLGELLERSKQDWDSVRSVLSLAADIDALDFWESVWLGVMKGCRGSGSDLACEVALGVIAQLCERPNAVPNGLSGSLRRFSNAGDIRYMLSKVLLQENIGTVLSAWPRFAARYSGRNCVSMEIGDVLRDAGLSSPRPLGLSELVVMLERRRVEPADAEVLGRLRFLTRENPDWASDSLRDLLNKLLFRSAADGWAEARKLLARHGSGLDADEQRRHALAPSEYRLHPNYYVKMEDEWPAVVFFLVCRQRMEAPTEKLAQWVSDADSEEARIAALEYLSDGELGDQVAEQVRERGWLASVLDDSRLMERLAEEKKDKLRRRLASASQIEQAVAADTDGTHGPQTEDPDDDRPSSEERAQAFFKRIVHWWADDRTRASVIDQHEEYCWPRWLREGGLADGLRRRSPDHWLALLVLGACQSLGRTQDAQHRSFLELAHEKSWWDVFLRPDDDRAWMGVLRAWQDEAIDSLEYRPWISLFPSIYQFSRHLDSYRALFTSIERRPKHLYDPSRVRAPRADDAFSGAGTQFDVPPLPLGIGFHWVLRELVRLRVLDASHVYPDCYVPARRILDLLRPLGLQVDDGSDAAAKSREIHDLLDEYDRSDPANPHFHLSFDIPFRHIAAAENEGLRRKWALDFGSHQTRVGDWVRSKSEVIIANLLFDHGIDYEYEKELAAPDGTKRRPDFTILLNAKEWYWEHWSMLDDEDYAVERQKKLAWYGTHFDGRLVETFEKASLTVDAEKIIKHCFGAE